MALKCDIVPREQVEGLIHMVRGQKIMLDSPLAALYGVEARVLNQAVKRNLERFPDDFMFRLSKEETALLTRARIVTVPGPNSSQIVMSSDASASKPAKPTASNWSQIVTSSAKHRGLIYRPFAFTEQGIAMLSSVLRSPRAVRVNIEIMRAFVRLRQLLASNADLARRLDEMEKHYDSQFKVVFEAIRQLMEKPDPLKPEHGREVGFHALHETPRSAPVPRQRRGRTRIRY